MAPLVDTLTAADALGLLVSVELCPFTDHDWSAFAGCTSKEPFIGESDEWIVVVDGSDLIIVDTEAEVEWKYSLAPS